MAELRFLSRADVIAAGGTDIAAAVADVRATFALLRRGEAAMAPENSIALGTPAQGRAYALPARLAGEVGTAGVKWTAHRPPAAVTEDAPAILGVTIVNDLATGWPIGIVESALLTTMRTAAVTALALAHLSPVPIQRVALLGAGAQARAHLRMLAARHPDLAEVTLWNRGAERREALRAAFPDLPFPLRLAATPAEAAEGTQAVISCTDARTPFLPDTIVAPGRLVAQIGWNEVPFAAIDRADAVVVDLWGPFAATSGKSLFHAHRAGRFPESRLAAELGAVLDGHWHPTPGSAVYFSSFGLNVFDIALATRVLRSAATRGLGTKLSLSGGPARRWPE